MDYKNYFIKYTFISTLQQFKLDRLCFSNDRPNLDT